ncbi:hypothetical protein D1155_10085 [Anaerotruncus sp. 80]|uniref:Uncharacterized protein n=1 Tax=Anaerotruncus colihominis TaxID=169435 RepID=A0A845QPN9_9FIRM|nr:MULTISPECIES: hypothetical protein [Anaerotruncus]NBH61998.1 hypothetical protein [Anaerotruncus colihominis]NCF02653.1 hypothetical protein [Anaerotruncus sp. 80]
MDKMTNTTVAKILEMHSVLYFIEAGRVFADSMFGGTEIFEEVIDVSDWSRKQLLHWLGY